MALSFEGLGPTIDIPLGKGLPEPVGNAAFRQDPAAGHVDRSTRDPAGVVKTFTADIVAV